MVVKETPYSLVQIFSIDLVDLSLRLPHKHNNNLNLARSEDALTFCEAQ